MNSRAPRGKTDDHVSGVDSRQGEADPAVDLLRERNPSGSDRSSAADSSTVADTATARRPFAALASGATPRFVGRDVVLRRSLLISDIASATLATAAVLIPFHAPGAPEIVSAVCSVSLLVVLLGSAMGLYARDENRLRKETLDEAPRLAEVAALAVFIMAAVAQVAGAHSLAGRPGAISSLVLCVVLACCLVAMRAGARSLTARLLPRERCLLLGDMSHAIRINRKLETNRALNAEIVGVIDTGRGGTSPRVGNSVGEPPAVGDVSDVQHLISGADVDRVMIVADQLPPDRLLEVIRFVKSRGIRVSILPGVLDAIGTTAQYDNLDGIVLMGVPSFGLGRSARATKRLMDLTIAAVALVCTAPLWAAIALAVKCTSSGPVFFRQKRVGRNGNVFEIVKFRTMVVSAEAQKADLMTLNQAAGLFKIADDPRVTRVGRVLRKTSLDELPQLLNIVRGEMSIVGPRPLVLSEDAEFKGWQRRRYDVAPGITGPWQILGSTRVPVSEMVVLDYLYCVNWTLWRDLKICLRTVVYLLSRQSGEYTAAQR